MKEVDSMYGIQVTEKATSVCELLRRGELGEESLALETFSREMKVLFLNLTEKDLEVLYNYGMTVTR